MTTTTSSPLRLKIFEWGEQKTSKVYTFGHKGTGFFQQALKASFFYLPSDESQEWWTITTTPPAQTENASQKFLDLVELTFSSGQLFQYCFQEEKKKDHKKDVTTKEIYFLNWPHFLDLVEQSEHFKEPSVFKKEKFVLAESDQELHSLSLFRVNYLSYFLLIRTTKEWWVILPSAQKCTFLFAFASVFPSSFAWKDLQGPVCFVTESKGELLSLLEKIPFMGHEMALLTPILTKKKKKTTLS